MYVPAYASVDPTHLLDLLRAWPFATVVTAGTLGLYATHVPLVPTAPDRLVGHLARANPHRIDLAGPVLATFLGPHAPVDPRWYREPARQVPTWNYVAVHATGTARLLPDPREALDALLDATGLAEGPIDSDRRAFLDGLERGIVGFEISGVRLEGKAKLSQNRDPLDHDRVRDGLLERATGQDREVATLMGRSFR